MSSADVTKLRILRFLPEDDLERMRRTARHMLTFIDQNRGNLVERKMYGIQIEEIKIANAFKIGIWPTFAARSKLYSFPPFTQPPEQPDTLQRPKSLVWTAERIYNARIDHLELTHFHFDNEETDEFVSCLQRRKARVEQVNVVNSIHNEENLVKLLRFVEVLHVKHLKIYERNVLSLKILFAEQFMETVTTLSSLVLGISCKDSMQAIFLPAEFYRLPPKLRMKHGVGLSVECLRKAVRAWWVDELELEVWKVNLPREAIDGGRSIAIDIELPCQVLSPGDYIYKNHQGKECRMRYLDDIDHVVQRTIGIELRRL